MIKTKNQFIVFYGKKYPISHDECDLGLYDCICSKHGVVHKKPIKKNPSALQTMRKELARIQQAISECVDESGVEYPWMKYKHQMLIREAEFFKKSIDWMESLKTGSV